MNRKSNALKTLNETQLSAVSGAHRRDRDDEYDYDRKRKHRHHCDEYYEKPIRIVVVPL